MVRNELSDQAVTVSGRKTKASSVLHTLRKVGSHKKKIAIAVFALLLVGAGVWLIIDRTVGNEDNREVKLLTEAQADQATLKKLQAKTPTADSSTKDKSEYYTQLEFAQVNVGDYRGAVDAFKRREAFVGYAFVYTDYMRLANYYYHLKENKLALLALDKAETLLPMANDPDTDYSRSDVLATINQFREALK